MEKNVSFQGLLEAANIDGFHFELIFFCDGSLWSLYPVSWQHKAGHSSVWGEAGSNTIKLFFVFDRLRSSECISQQLCTEPIRPQMWRLFCNSCYEEQALASASHHPNFSGLRQPSPSHTALNHLKTYMYDLKCIYSVLQSYLPPCLTRKWCKQIDCLFTLTTICLN